MKKKQNILTEKYLATAPIGQAPDVFELKRQWMKVNFVDHFPDNKATCLEIGPGQGELLMLWKELGYKNVEAIDISKDVCQHLGKVGLNCMLVDDSRDFLKKRKSRYDLIVLNDVLEHIPKDEIVPIMQALFCSLKPSGKVILKVPNAQSPHFAVGRYGDLTHVQAFTETSFVQLFRASGFKKYYFFSEREPCALSLKYYLANYIVKPLYFWWIRNIRSATGHSSPKILTQAIIAVAEK